MVIANVLFGLVVVGLFYLMYLVGSKDNDDFNDGNMSIA